MKAIVLGLTGGIGTGKSTVLQMFKEIGAKTIDSDKIVAAIYKKKAVKKTLEKEFGEKIFSKGTVDRKKLGEIAFSSSKKRQKLEAIVHPFVYREIKEKISKHKKYGKKLVVAEVPLLFESSKKFLALFDFVVVVNAKKGQQVHRLLKKGLSRKNVLQRLRAQMPLSEKAKKADFVIDNSKNLFHTKRQVMVLWWGFE